MDKPVKLGISSCLLGERVRYDGGHKLERRLVDTVGRHFTLVPVCPEVESGMPVPREAMRLEGDPANPRLITIGSRIDLTDRMRVYCIERVARLEREGICGFIFKQNSPSSGLHGVKIYNGGVPTAEGRGLFAAEVVRRFPLLPVQEEGSLSDPVLLEHFIEQVFIYSHMRRST
jgi:uncharacterized protein YbbK (DUF523 family)